MLDLALFQDLRLHGGFTLVEVQLTAEPLLDPLERAAKAQTIIRGNAGARTGCGRTVSAGARPVLAGW